MCFSRDLSLTYGGIPQRQEISSDSDSAKKREGEREDLWPFQVYISGEVEYGGERGSLP